MTALFPDPVGLVRPRLLRLVGPLAATPLLVVQAPAGFGKTTLLRQVAAARRASGVRVLWLDLESGDNDPQRLQRRVQALFASRQPARSTALGLQALLDTPLWRRPFVLCLDECDVLTEPAALQWLRDVVEHLPAHGEVVLGTRETATLGLGRWRARGLLREIGAEALRFSLEEACDFFRVQRGLVLREADVRALWVRTEGWAAALYLASLALAERRDHAAFVASFSGTHLTLAEFLAQDVLARQPPELRAFLLDTSVLPAFDATLCAALRAEDTPATAYLARLQAANLFLVPLTARPGWFRYHSLFASFLRAELAREHPGRERVLLTRAAQWLADQGDIVGAMDNLLAAGEDDAALALLVPWAQRLLEQGRVRLLVRWCERLGPARLREQPRLQLVHAWALVFSRRCAEAAGVLDAALAGVQDEAALARLTLEAGLVRCMAANMSDQVAQGHALSAALMPQVPVDQPFLFRSLANILARSLVSASRYEAARAVLAEAQRREPAGGSSFMRFVADSLEGCIELSQGRLGAARARLQAAADRALAPTETQRSGGRASISLLLAAVLYEADERVAAQRIAADCMPFAREHGTPDAFIIGGLTLARVALVQGDRAGWQRHLADLEHDGRAMGLPRAQATAWLERARIATLEGDLATASEALALGSDPAAWPDLQRYCMHANEVDVPWLAGCRLALARGEAATQLVPLQQAMRRASALQRLRRLLKLRLWYAQALADTGASAKAQRELGVALRFARQEGYVRPFLDEGAGIVGLLRDWLRAGRRGREAALVAFAEDVLGRWREPAALPPAAGQAPAERLASGTAWPAPMPVAEDLPPVLTAREREVLVRLAYDDSNRSIAEGLFISEATVKRHLSNIYGKLGTHRRTLALLKARRLGLLADREGPFG